MTVGFWVLFGTLVLAGIVLRLFVLLAMRLLAA